MALHFLSDKELTRLEILRDLASDRLTAPAAAQLQGVFARKILETQGKIERWHQTLKNRILLEKYFLPGDLEAQIGPFIEHYNHARYHESLENVTPADAYFGRAADILRRRARVKRLEPRGNGT